MSEVNNDSDETIYQIRNSSNEVKIDFITNVISETEIPSEFQKLVGSNPEKIFYEIKDGCQSKREWVLFYQNTFYCVYCVCFSPLNGNRLVTGVEYEKGCRISEFLKTHDLNLHHIGARNRYSELFNQNNGEITCKSAKRNVITAIVKIIIYIATHGQYFLNDTKEISRDFG